MTTSTVISEPSRPFALPRWTRDLGLSFAICVFVYGTYAAAGFPTLADPGGDNDSMLRLVEIRDLLAGQAWFDLHQYRMGLDGGFLMHWSRLIDAPIAAIILAASAVGAAPAMAETIALILWPLLLMIATLFALIQLARGLGDEHTVLPAVTLGTGALYFIGIYRPGSIDHHNAQIALTVAMVAFLVRAPQFRSFSLLAGLCAAVMLAIGMETAPYVAAGGACVALAFLFGNQEEARRAALFGMGFAAFTMIAFLVTVGPSSWSVPACDAMSKVQLSLAGLAGVGIATIAVTPLTNASFTRRLLAMLVLGAVFMAIARFSFPQCLGDPFADFDPRLREIWLNSVTEAQSIVSLAEVDWTKLLVYFLTPAMALVVLAGLILRRGFSRGLLIYGGFLLAAFLVSCWQVRGSSFAIPLATTALALAIGTLRAQIAAGGSPMQSIALVLAWLASFNLVWSAAANAFSARVAEVAAMPGSQIQCAATANFAYLATLPEGTVLAVSDLGSPILVNTPHRALSGPYHRNVDGNLAMINALLGTADEASYVARAKHVDYVVLCRGNVESVTFPRRAPDGLMADLMAGRVPAWLSLDAASRAKAIEIYRVVPRPAG
jgi:hypothetical protein